MKKSLTPIVTLLQEQHSRISTEWHADVVQKLSMKYPDLLNEQELSLQIELMLNALTTLFIGYTGDASPDISANSPLGKLARDLSAEQARKGYRPLDTSEYIVSMKMVITRHLVPTLSEAPDTLISCLQTLEGVLDRLALLTFESYVETREAIIAQQSLSLLELSTPPILLWHNVLLLPLVGVIDTSRARQFTERLLGAIAAHEAAVTIIDVTGVPVLDTSVARHIMKAVDAAHLLGSRIIMTGIGPEGAQTLTKLGINFSNVISRASLRAGVAEALKLVGHRIAAINGEHK